MASTCSCRCSRAPSSSSEESRAVLGGLLVGLAEALAVPLIGAEYRAAVSFLVLLAVLLVRPHGLLGQVP